MDKPNRIETNPSANLSPQKKEKVQKVAEQFEAIFLQMMFKEMMGTLDESMFGSSTGNHIYQGMFEEKMTTFLSESKGVGLKEQISAYLFDKMDAKQFDASKIQEMLDEIPSNSLLTDEMSVLSQRATHHKAHVYNVEDFRSLIEEASSKYNVPVTVITEVIRAESNGNPRAVSKVGAKGLMQLMDKTAEELEVKNSFNPRENIMGGTKYLKEMLTEFNGDLEKSLAAYNAGPSNVKKYNGIPPFQETQNYVAKIMKKLSEKSDE